MPEPKGSIAEKREQVRKFLSRPALTFSAEWEKLSREKRLARVEPGHRFPGEGVFVGRIESLGKIFNVFAAPEDLTDKDGKKVLQTFNDAVKRIAELKNWHGHRGGKTLVDTLVTTGEWFIPPLNILKALQSLKDKGSLKGSFASGSGIHSHTPDWYWSSTIGCQGSSGMKAVLFKTGTELYDDKIKFRFSCRPVRLAPAAPSALVRHIIA